MEEQSFDGMNVMPLVDVMLVLLTIVLTTSSFIATGQIPVKLPEVQAMAKKSIPQKKTIVITKAGELYLGSSMQSKEDLKAHLQLEDKSIPILIRADQAVQLQFFVEVLDLVKELKFENVMLKTAGKS